MKEAKTSQDIFDRAFDNCFAEYFRKRFSKNHYDINRLRQELDSVSFRSSCTYFTEDNASEDLSRLEKCEIVLESLKSKKEPSTSYLAIMCSFAGVIIGSNISNNPSLLQDNLLFVVAVGIITILFVILIAWVPIRISNENKLMEAYIDHLQRRTQAHYTDWSRQRILAPKTIRTRQNAALLSRRPESQSGNSRLRQGFYVNDETQPRSRGSKLSHYRMSAQRLSTR